jgi:DMSO/TMAO reductase YedYZ molybdopterin-dependent catalytic subunit
MPTGDLIVLSTAPLNAETPLAAQIGIITPNARFYVRNHFRVPRIDADSWSLTVNGAVRHHLALSLPDLRRLPSRSVIATLECAGNGRALLDPAVPGEQWKLGAVSTAEWTGVSLVEVLDRAGVTSSAREIVFRGADSGKVHGGKEALQFERSLPVESTRNEDVLLAYAMNGETLPANHGFPLRLVVPGWYGMASVKWLTQIEATSQPFTGYFQTERYVIAPPEAGAPCEPLSHMPTCVSARSSLSRSTGMSSAKASWWSAASHGPVVATSPVSTSTPDRVGRRPACSTSHCRTPGVAGSS